MNGIKSGYWSVETVEFLKVVLSNTDFVVKESDGISEVITIISLLERIQAAFANQPCHQQVEAD